MLLNSALVVPLTFIFLSGAYGNSKSKLADFLSGFTRRSADVLVGTMGMIYPDNSVLYELVEHLKEKMRTDHPTLDLPILDPFWLNEMDFTITNEKIGELAVGFRGLNITYLSAFEVNKVKMHWLTRKLELDVCFRTLHANVLYDLGGTVGKTLPVYGNGPLNLTATDITLSGIMHLRTVNNSLHINNLHINFSTGTFQVNATNLLGGGRIGDLLNMILSEDAPRILELVRTDITYHGAGWLQGVGNDILGKLRLSFNDVLDFVKNVGTKRVQSILGLNFFNS